MMAISLISGPLRASLDRPTHDAYWQYLATIDTQRYNATYMLKEVRGMATASL